MILMWKRLIYVKQRGKQDDTDVKESDSGEKDEDKDHRSTLVPWNEFDNPQRVRAYSKLIISETPAEIDLINVYI